MTGDRVDHEGWDPSRYDDDHAFVYQYGEEVLDWLEPTPGERILDLGCGTGKLTAAIADAGATVVGLDRSADMLETAHREHPTLPLVRADAQAFSFGRPFDAVFTNATLHWLDEPERAFGTVADALGSGGRFVGEFGGRGNVSAIVDAVEAELEDWGYETTNPWYFPSVGQFATSLEAAGFEVRRAVLFDRPVELEGGEGGLRSWLAMFGDSLLASVPDAERDDVLSGIEDQLHGENFREGSWVADYRRLRFEAMLE